jgi:hypothetical protein
MKSRLFGCQKLKVHGVFIFSKLTENLFIFYCILFLPGGRSTNLMSSSTAKRRKTMEMREKVQSQGAFSSRAHERASFARPSNPQLNNGKFKKDSRSLTKDVESSVTEGETGASESEGGTSALLGKSGYVTNAVMDQDVEERRESWFSKFRRKTSSVKPKAEFIELRGKKNFYCNISM